MEPAQPPQASLTLRAQPLARDKPISAIIYHVTRRRRRAPHAPRARRIPDFQTPGSRFFPEGRAGLGTDSLLLLPLMLNTRTP